MSNPKISIITVCYNAIETIEKTIKSVLAQEYNNIEYIIIDGGSTDGTLDVIKKYSSNIAKCISEPDNGIYDAMNKGIKYSTGDWIHFRNSGDYFVSKHSLELCFQNDIPETVGIVHGNCIYINNEGYIEHTPNILEQSFQEIMPILHPATFVRATIQKEYLFDTKYKSSADYDLFYRLCKKGINLLYLPIAIATYDEGGFSSNWQRAFFEDRTIQGRNSTYFQKLISYIICKKKDLRKRGHDFIISNISFIRKKVERKRIIKKQNRTHLPYPYDYTL